MAPDRVMTVPAGVPISGSRATATLKRAIRRAPIVHRALYGALKRRRVEVARRYLQVGGIFPEDREAILADYDFACTHTHRGISQSVNLEQVIRYVVERRLGGAFVECGTYTGGALAYALRALVRHGDVAREIYGFDSFEGMPNPTLEDGDRGARWILGRSIGEASVNELAGRLVGSDVNRASYEACLAFLRASGYPQQRIHLVKGWFQDTLPAYVGEIGPIAVLRLDGDLYESTKVCLETLFDRVVDDGVVIIDDYGTFEGCRRAVDEFLAVRGRHPYIVYVDLGIRYFVKA